MSLAAIDTKAAEAERLRRHERLRDLRDGFKDGGAFVLDVPAIPESVWGMGNDVLWAEDEPMLVTGVVGGGKTTLSGLLVRGRLGLDSKVLGYPVTPGTENVLYLAMDRPSQIGRSLRRQFDPSERGVLEERLKVWSGPPLKDIAHDADLLLDYCEAAEADTLVIDAMKDAAIGLSDDEVGAAVNRALQTVVKHRIQVVGNHHQRKSTSGKSAKSRKPKSLDDLYGSRWISAGAGTVLLLWAETAGSTAVELSMLKSSANLIEPADLFHDMSAGTLDLSTTMTVEDALKAGGWQDIKDLCSLTGRGTTRADREAVRRVCRRLVSAGLVEESTRTTAVGGTSAAVWRWL